MHRFNLVLAACAAAIVVPYADAQVVFSGPVDIPLVRDFTGTAINLVTGAVNTSNNAPNDSVADFIVFDVVGEWRFANLDNDPAGLVAIAPDSTSIALLAPGDFVGPGLPLWPLGGGNSDGRFDNVFPSYVGLLFENEASGTFHYGWVELELPATGPGRVTGYAYNATPLTGLVIPEPTSLGLMGLASSTLLRRRRP
ncbi:MAG: PEP-CTERM sorting domain-containing protein [Phycisphaerae bacterium]